MSVSGFVRVQVFWVVWDVWKHSLQNWKRIRTLSPRSSIHHSMCNADPHTRIPFEGMSAFQDPSLSNLVMTNSAHCGWLCHVAWTLQRQTGSWGGSQHTSFPAFEGSEVSFISFYVIHSGLGSISKTTKASEQSQWQCIWSRCQQGFWSKLSWLPIGWEPFENSLSCTQCWISAGSIQELLSDHKQKDHLFLWLNLDVEFLLQCVITNLTWKIVTLNTEPEFWDLTFKEDDEVNEWKNV